MNAKGEVHMPEGSKDKKQCPRCEESLSLIEEEHQGSNGKMKILRCSRCAKISSARLAGEPDRILRKELIEGGIS